MVVNSGTWRKLGEIMLKTQWRCSSSFRSLRELEFWLGFVSVVMSFLGMQCSQIWWNTQWPMKVGRHAKKGLQARRGKLELRL